MLVTEPEPTPGYHDAYSVGTPTWAFLGNGWQNHCNTTFSLSLDVFFLVSKRTIYSLERLVVWMLHIGRARHPGPGERYFTPCQLSVEFVKVGGWLTFGDLALDSCAQFLAVAEHRLIPSRARSISYQLRRAGSPVCLGLQLVRIRLLGVMLRSGSLALGGAHLSLPYLC